MSENRKFSTAPLNLFSAVIYGCYPYNSNRGPLALACRN